VHTVVVGWMNFVRIGSKLINRKRITRVIDGIIDLRARGMSQQDVADEMGVDRSFISRLEGIGEVRKGKRIALVGFPIGNKSEVGRLAERYGVDFVFLMSEDERWDYVRENSGAQLANRIMELISEIKEYDAVVFLASDMRIKTFESILGDVLIGLEIGNSPLQEDQIIDLGELEQVLAGIGD